MNFGRLRNCYSWLGDVLFPRHCLQCEKPMSNDPGFPLFIHQDCLSHLYQFDELTGRVRGNLLGVSKSTDRASVQKTFYEEGRSLWEYRELGRALLRELKYHHGTYLQKDFRHLLNENTYWREFLAGAILVPVPLHSSRLKNRGFNQSEWIARIFISLLPDIEFINALERISKTVPQVTLPRKDRLKNLETAFSIREKIDLDRERRYVLIDDVYTTGSTVNACAKVLRKAGCKHIDFLTLAHG